MLVLARWEEFEQHEESMGQQLQEQKPQETEAFDDNNETVNVDDAVNARPPLSTDRDSPMTVIKPVSGHQRSTAVLRRPPLLRSMPTSYAVPQVDTKAGITSAKPSASEPHWLKQVTNRAHVAISSVLGQSVRRYDDLTPPGLRNPGQNVCFLNAIVQAIAHTPCLPDAVLQLRHENPSDRLVWYLGELMEQLSTPRLAGVPLVLDSSKFRTQASFEFPGGLIQRPFQMPQQRQQDAAECLTWIVQWLHSRMNRMSLHRTAASSIQPLGTVPHFRLSFKLQSPKIKQYSCTTQILNRSLPIS